ncbi:MAG: DNA mismatch repair protein MutS [Clostridia bacterium]|nr:DNA mismatch repair protein MutS [Clostridia bacterium]
MAEMTPMMKQYLQIKEQYPDTILFYRLGDFYEMFFDDAKLASAELELVLTGRDCGLPEKAPMCGVPFHACETYIAKLVSKGYRVAICEQTEDPASAKGIVRREVIRVVTPGTVIESSMLTEGENNYLAVMIKTVAGAGLCFADCSTGEIYATQLSGEDVSKRAIDEFGRFRPTEILIDETTKRDMTLLGFFYQRLLIKPQVLSPDVLDYPTACASVLGHFHKRSLTELSLEEAPAAVTAIGALIDYLHKTQMNGLERIDRLEVYSDVQHMHLDLTARRNLELVETMRSKEKRGSLLGVLDRTKTAMGKRLIRTWIERPLLNPAQISRRQSAVGELVKKTVLRGDLRESLAAIYDLERIMTRIVYGSANAKELRSLAQTITYLPPIKKLLEDVSASMLQDIRRELDTLDDIRDLIERAIVDDPPFSVREGGMIRKGYNEEIDELNFEMNDGKGVIARVEAEEKEKTGIRTLKVGYSRTFGYYIEVSRSFADQVPEHYIRKQTLVNGERYITQELKELEARVLGAKERVIALEYRLFTEVREKVASELQRVQITAQAIARLDALASFAEVAAKSQYVCPIVDNGDEIIIKNGRHPVVEALLDTPFVPNDTALNRQDRVMIITGPNMAGKSTYMRQTALIVLMAQIGSFVPAESATIGVVDSIFTRVGASDDLAAGQSTFMLEMSEVADILKNATSKSLVVFDEIGRGTSTYDGMSIARAVLEYVADPAKIGAKTLFATHYHELTVVEQEFSCMKNYSVAVKKRGDDITFLRRIVRGPADESYGIEVAKLAGIPDNVVVRAKEILRSLDEEGTPGPVNVQQRFEPVLEPVSEDAAGQLSLLPMAESGIVERLREMDVNTLTPIEALQTLYELVKEAQSL